MNHQQIIFDRTCQGCRGIGIIANVPGAFEMFEEIVNRGFPIRHIRPTHCARDKYVSAKHLNLRREAAVSTLQPGVPAALKVLLTQ